MRYRTRTPRRTATQCPNPEPAASSSRTCAKWLAVTKENLIPPTPRLDQAVSEGGLAVVKDDREAGSAPTLILAMWELRLLRAADLNVEHRLARFPVSERGLERALVDV